MEEQWKPIDGCPHYEISTVGRVRSYKNKKKIDSTPHLMSPRPNRDGYMQIDLRQYPYHHYKTIHRLVAQAFIPNPNNYGYHWELGHPTFTEYLAQLNISSNN